jgi:hypothetical protein
MLDGQNSYKEAKIQNRRLAASLDPSSAKLGFDEVGHSATGDCQLPSIARTPVFPVE